MIGVGRTPTGDRLMMRKFVCLAMLAGLGGCQNVSGPFANKAKDRDHRGAPDPLLSPNLDEQQKYGRSRFSYPEDDRGVAPSGFAGRGTPSGR